VEVQRQMFVVLQTDAQRLSKAKHVLLNMQRQNGEVAAMEVEIVRGGGGGGGGNQLLTDTN
jgi:hypothetical protein